MINGRYYEENCNVAGEPLEKHLKWLRGKYLNITQILAVLLLVVFPSPPLQYSSNSNTDIFYLLSPYYAPGVVLNISPRSFLTTNL